METEKKDRRIRKTRKAIRDALIALLKTKPYESISVTELSRAADVDRKTFYLHYRSTEDVLQEILGDATASVRELLQEESFDIRETFEKLSGIMMENVDFYRMISTTTAYARFLSECKNILKSLIRETKFEKSGLPRETFEVYAEYIASGIIGVYTNWLSSPSISLDTLTGLTSDAVEHAWAKVMTPGQETEKTI